MDSALVEATDVYVGVARGHADVVMRAVRSELGLDDVRTGDAVERSWVRRLLDRLLRLTVGERATEGRMESVAARVDAGARRVTEGIVGVKLSEVTTEGVRAAAVRRNVALIKEIQGATHFAVQSVLLDPASDGLSAPALAARLQAELNVVASKAEFWAVDQTLKLHSEVTKARHEEAGIEEYIWTTSRDRRVRREHADLEGTRHRWDSPPVTNHRGDRNHPGHDYRCRCNAYPVLPGVDV